MFTYDVHGETKQAVIVHDGPTIDGDGWYVESWARCDLAEFPDSLSEEAGVQVWSDTAGNRVATTEIQSYRGSEHCGWEQMTFLELDKDTYVRNPVHGLGNYFDEHFSRNQPLPADAVDTGYHLDGKHLWLSPDSKRAYVGTGDRVDMWPRETQPLGCA